ncbi:VOC family protein [Halorubrum sp. DTA98]|uniref:VOC family protein n=1 Tax=Halorubrum sp. DTA98 TaxID=3402163 RepID=UPI003AADFF7E
MGIDIVDMDHVAIHVTDLDAALAFYHELLGMDIRDRGRYDDGDVPYVAVVAGGRHVHLVPVEDPSAGPEARSSEREIEGGDIGSERDVPFRGDHLCLLVRSDDTDTKAELEDLLAEIDAAGYEVEPDEPKMRYGAYGRDWAAYVRDPDGRRVELKLH